jgi:hypothetical protein
VVTSARRLEVIEAGSVAVGNAWVEHVERDLRVDRRRVAGGWPGTIREARARTYAYFVNEVLTPDELDLAARTVYGYARHRWLEKVR